MDFLSSSSTSATIVPEEHRLDEHNQVSIVSLVHNSSRTLSVLKKAMVDMSWIDMMQRDEGRRKRLNVFKTVLRELSRCCTDVQVGLRKAKGNHAVGE